MSESVVDYAGLGASVPTGTGTDSSAVEAPVVDTGSESTADVSTGAGSETENAGSEKNADGTPRTEAQRADPLSAEGKSPEITKMRSWLKELRDSDPEKHGAFVKEAHGSIERWAAVKALCPGGVKEITDNQNFLRELAGVEAGKPVTLSQARESISRLQNTVAQAEESDQQLYAGDKQLIDNVVSDLKSQGKLEAAMPKLTSGMLSSLKTESPTGYAKVIIPTLVNELRTAGFVDAVNTLHRMATQSGDQAMTAKVAAIGKWYTEMQDSVQTAEQEEVSSERQALIDEKNSQASTAKTTFQNGVASSCEKSNNQLLGTELKGFLKMSFFQGFGRTNLMPLGNTIKSNLYATLKADTAYQSQMRAMWGAKNPDRARIEEYHKAKVSSVARDVVRNTVQAMYPNYAKGGAAAGRVAAAAEKKAITGRAEASSAATGKPIYVAVKPKDLDRTRKDSTLLEITGKGYLPNGKFITWRR